MTLAAAASTALADYAVTITGGSWTTAGSHTLAKDDVGGVGGCPTGGATVHAAGSYVFTSGSGTALCQGAMTAHFVWQGAAPRPQALVVRETATAAWSGDSGACDPGLPNVIVVSSSPTGESKTATRYPVVTSPAASFDLTVTPTANASSAGGGGGENRVSPEGVRLRSLTTSAGGASVSYAVSATPIVLSVGGATIDSSGKANILVGQGATGQLSAGGYTITPGSYSWSVGGTTFASWVASGDQETATLNYVPASEWSKPSPHWYWSNDQNAIAVSCSAIIVTPDGVSRPVSAHRDVDVWPPTYSFSNNTASRSTITYLGGLEVVPDQGTSVQAGYVAGGEYQEGETFVGAVVTPDLFGPNGGSWNFLQIASPSRTHSGPLGTRADSCSGLTGLDNDWPYDAVPGGETLPTWSAPAGGATLIQARHRAVDSPSTGNLSSETSYSIGDSFDMSLMFRPPGSDTQYVRIHKFQWGWSGADQRASENAFWSNPHPSASSR